MSDRHPSRSEMSGLSMSFNQSAWMGHWMQAKDKQPRGGDLCLQSEDGCKMKQRSLSFNPEPCGSKSSNGVREMAQNVSMEVTNRLMNDDSNLKKESTDLLSFPIFNVPRQGSASSKKVPGSQIGQCSKFDGVEIGMEKPHIASVVGCQFLETEFVSTGCKFLRKETTPNLELELAVRDSVENGCVPTVRPSRGKLPGMPSGYPYGIMSFATMSSEHLTHRSSYNGFNVETMRISSTLDASQDIGLGLPMYAKTTRHLFITEKTALGVSDEDKIFGESMLSPKFHGNLGGLLTLSPASGQHPPGLKLQLLDCSTDSEQKNRGTKDQSIGKLDTVTGLTNETSAETRIMDVDTSLENNHTTDLAVSRSNEVLQDVLRGQSTALPQGKLLNTGLPDVNLKARALDGSTEEGERSTSRTQSLDMECLISHGHYPSSSKSIHGTEIDPGPELGSRWVKRLKLSGTKFVGLGTESKILEEGSSYKKLGKLSSSLLNRGVCLISSEPPTGTGLRYNSDSKKTGEVPNLSNGGKASSTYSLKDARDTLLSHTWIRRWRHHHQSSSPEKQPAPTDPSQPDTPKTNFDHIPKKTFPSIAAMALMGKAMNGFRPCEFTKKGSFIVWSTNNH